MDFARAIGVDDSADSPIAATWQTYVLFLLTLDGRLPELCLRGTFGFEEGSVRLLEERAQFDAFASL